MKIGFLILRDTFLKTMGALIEASADRDHDVLLFYDPNAIGGDKAHQQVTGEKLTVFEKDQIRIENISLDQLDSLGVTYQLDLLVTHEGYYVLQQYLEKLKELRNSGTALVSLSHFYEIAKNPLGALEYFDKTYYLGQFGLDTHFKLWSGYEREADSRKQYADKVDVVSSPMLDQLAGLDKQKVRSELGIPAGKKVVVLFAPVISPVTPWRFYIWDQSNKLKRIQRIIKDRKWKYLAEALTARPFEEVAQAIRRFCDQNHAFLIVKSRQKQNDPSYLKQIADLYLSGEQESYYPVFASYKILAVADLCIAAMSMSVVEAIAAGVPVVNIYVPHLDLEGLSEPSQHGKREYMDAIMNIERDGPFNFPGCVTVVDRGAIVGWFKGKKIGDLAPDPARLRVYQANYLGMEELSSSERILNSIESLIASKQQAILIK